MALASRFQSSADVFQRLSTLSALPTIRYWSVSRQSWQPLVLEVVGLDASGKPSTQVPSADLVAGREVAFQEREEHTGKATYRLRVLDRSDARVVVSVENVTAVKFAILTGFEPGALQTTTFIRRDAPRTWSTYQITRVGTSSNALVLRYPSSFLNRLEALRRYLAGLPSDLEPPVAPN